MTSNRQLYELQELDLAIDDHRNLIRALEAQLAELSPMERASKELEQLRQRVQQLLGQQRDQELTVQSLRQKAAELERRLYSGSVVNPKELTNMERELAMVKQQGQGVEERLLETMVALEEAQQDLRQREDRVQRDNQVWEARNVQLVREKNRLREALDSLIVRRQAMSSLVDRSELSLYEQLRAAKGGRAVAKMERGICQACRVTLPTHQAQQVRLSKGLVLCPNCGRILYST